MDSEITVESLPLFGTCILCTNEGIAKSLLIPYSYKNQSEIYTDMLMQCFAIDISMLQIGDTKKLICNECIKRLREATNFRNQVEAALKTLEATILFGDPYVKTSIKVESNSKDEIDTLEGLIAGAYGEHINPQVKQESVNNTEIDMGFDDGGILDDDVGSPDIPLQELKKEKQDSPKILRRARKSIKVKSKLKYSLKKTQDLKESEEILAAGLFPFKIKKNMEIRTFACCICPETTTNLDNLKLHTLEHSKSLIHHEFKKMIYSKSHRYFKNQNKFRCKLCTTDINNYEELKDHIDNCNRIKHSLKNHKINNLPFKLEKDQLDCPICKKTFLNFVNLNTHMNTHYPNYICESCGKAFASIARLRGHMRTHEIGSFPCKYCDAVFDRVTKRENHVSKEHKAGVRYACKRCNITLPSFYARQKHLAEVHNEELKRYKCSACTQSYITPGHLSSHVRRDHLNERNHKCDKCDQAFYTKNALKMHMIKHDGERIFSCHVCLKSYQRKKTLREHLRIHDNDKRFVCPVCSRAFTQKCTLKGHLKVHERKVDGPGTDIKPELYSV